MRIDLHCHTKKVKSGDGDGRNVSLELFCKKIIDANVRIVAITNHNIFDLEQYTLFQEKISDSCFLWPGIEIDIQHGNKNKWHLIVVANPDNAKEFSDSVNKLFVNKNIENGTCEFSEVYKMLNGCDVIYIAHFHKTPGITEEELEELLDLVGDESRVFVETPDKRTLGVLANYGYNVMIGSDVKDWNKYEQSTFAELRLPVSNFQQFCLLAKRDSSVVNTLLNKRKAYKLTASPHTDVNIPVTIYQDVNIIFGQKGTGKSEILKSLHEQMNKRGISCTLYEGGEKDSHFKDMLKNKDMERDLSLVGANDCEDSFKKLCEWKDSKPTLFGDYLNWHKTKDNNKNKKRMKITDATNLVEGKPKEYDVQISDKETIQWIFDKINSIDLSKYINENDKNELLLILGKLKDKNIEILKDSCISIESCKLTNFTIERIKFIADKNSETTSKPSTVGFTEFVNNRIDLFENAQKILQNINKKEYNKENLLGKIEGKGEIYINKKYRMLCGSSRADEFDIGIRKLQEIVKQLNTIKNNFHDTEIATTVHNFSENCFSDNISSLKMFLGLSKQVVTKDGEVYSPSGGERGILLLQKKLSENVDAYFLDEPELGMGNSYIDTNIRPILSELGKASKTVVVATHNANIAVRTLPYMSIFRVHENGCYRTYTGNPFDDKLINVDDCNDIKSWTEESLHTLEGGEDAFYERKSIYETRGN